MYCGASYKQPNLFFKCSQMYSHIGQEDLWKRIKKSYNGFVLKVVETPLLKIGSSSYNMAYHSLKFIEVILHILLCMQNKHTMNKLTSSSSCPSNNHPCWIHILFLICFLRHHKATQVVNNRSQTDEMQMFNRN